jgi:hypothetical protein
LGGTGGIIMVEEDMGIMVVLGMEGRIEGGMAVVVESMEVHNIDPFVIMFYILISKPI